MNDELAFLDATALAELVRTREVTPEELLDGAVARIEALNPSLNAVVAPLYDQARAAIAEGLPHGPFRGVPFVLKDLLAEAGGTPFTAGSKFVAGAYTSKRDSELVARYRRAGLVIAAKTNTPEFGLVPTTEPQLFGPSRNPWDPTRTTGGSSGGSAAAVAAGLVPMGHANDGGGSIRIPASCCGLFGLKPTRGRITLGPRYGELSAGLVNEHAVTRSVRDSAALLDATAGPMPGDPYAAPPPERPYAEEVGRDPGRLRIAVRTDPLFGGPAHKDCVAAVEAAATLCESLGHHVEAAAPRLDGEVMARALGVVWVAGLGAMVDGWARKTGRAPGPEWFEPATWRSYLKSKEQSVNDYLGAVHVLHALSRPMGAFFQDWDVLLSPTLAEPPMPLGWFDFTPEDVGRYAARLGRYTGYTMVANMTGQPAASVPLHWSADGLPIGVQVLGRYGDEATLFRLAAQMEAERPWAARRPPAAA